MVCKPQVVEGSSRLQRERGTTVYSISWRTKAVKPGVLLRLGDHDGPPGLQALHVKDFRGIQGRFPGNKWRFIRGLRFAAWAVTAVPGPLGTKDNQLLMGGHVQGLCQSPYQGELTAAIQHQRPVRLWCDCQGVVRGLTHLLQRRVLKKNAPHSNLFHTHWEFPVLCRLQVELPALLDASEALRTFPWSQSFEVVSVQYCFFCAGVQLGATFDAPKVSDTHTHIGGPSFFWGLPGILLQNLTISNSVTMNSSLHSKLLES